MTVLHAFNVSLYALNAGVWYVGAHHTGMAVLSLLGVGVAGLLWNWEPR
jgi:hypothetical protein